MPYDTLPQRYRDMIPAEAGQDIFRNTINSTLADGKSEDVAFASAWAALQRAGYERNEDGKWVEKTQPSGVHVPGTDWEARKARGAEPVYAYRPVLNAEMIRTWAAQQGFEQALPADDMHVTVVFSKVPFSAEMTEAASRHAIVRYGNIVVRGGKRSVVPLGDKGAVVLKIECPQLQYEHLDFRAMGASWDYQEYTPHITITYRGVNISPLETQPFTGDIVLGPLYAKPLNPDWDGEVVETPVTNQAALTKAEYQGRTVTLNRPRRLPKGSSRKFEVFVRDGDRVKRVTFGDPDMEIRRDDAEARANFRARHSCDTATDRTSARYWSCRMWTARSTVRDLAKRYLNDDTFTTREEAVARSVDLGLGGAIHVHQTADGQATYMPGESHEDYLENAAERAGLEDFDEDDSEAPDGTESNDLLERVISAIVNAVTKGEPMEDTFTKTAEVIKTDSERRIAWGWASVSTLKGEIVTDRQGDQITPAEMEKMADRFMLSARTAKVMHEGEGMGEVIHSLPLTKELADALGIATDREGWIIGMKIHDDDTWQMFKDGTLRAFSIGGRTKRKEIV